MMYRYRDNQGATQTSIQSFKHLVKLGKIKQVIGYRYKGRYNTSHIAVMVKGENGSCRFSGLSWGYGGTGPRGLKHLFDIIGIDYEEQKRVLTSPWPNFNGDNKTFWTIKL